MTTIADKIARYNLKRMTAYNRLKETYASGASIANDPNEKGTFLARATGLNDMYSDFQTAHNSLVGLLASEEEFQNYDALRIQADTAYYGAKAIYHDNAITSATQNSNSEGDSTAFEQVTANLPKLNIPKFSGDFKEWPGWYDLYKSVVHDKNFPSVEKFKYLLTSLEGEPLAIIKGLPITNANYSIAFDKLVERYQNVRFLATHYFHQIYFVSPLQKVSSTELRSLLNIFSENNAALRVLGLPVEQWDFVLFNILLLKLDNKTRTDYELQATHSSIQLPTYRELTTFLQNQCVALESVQLTAPSLHISSSKPKAQSQNSNTYKKYSTSAFLTTPETSQNDLKHQKPKCILCKKSNHLLHRCTTFIAKTPHERYAYIKQINFCLNCLKSSHDITKCTTSLRCRICQSAHHTLLHFNPPASQTPNHTSTALPTFPLSSSGASMLPSYTQGKPTAFQASYTGIHTSYPSSPASTAASHAASRFQTNLDSHNTQPPGSHTNFVGCTMATPQDIVMLSTAEVDIQDVSGKYVKIRILLDTGSMANFITEECVTRLGLPRKPCLIPIEGLNGMETSSNSGIVSCILKPQGQTEPLFNFDAIILPEVCSKQPKVAININSWEHIRNLPLADGNPFTPGKIHALIGAELVPLFLGSNKVIGQSNQPIALETIFGYILQGKASLRAPEVYCNPLSNFHVSTLDETALDYQLEKFWEIENIPKTLHLSPEDRKCEEIYKAHTYRTPSGRFAVPLPFKHPNPNLGNSYSAAFRRFILLESKLSKNAELYRQYSDFMRDYLESGHMTLVPQQGQKSSSAYYVPHHCVFKTDNAGTKIRVVFDSSQRSATGMSLNDALLTGPKLQRDISNILLSFRFHKYCFVCDIKQMYRQILIQPQYYDYQRILWRFAPTDPLEEYYLVTVFYGNRSSPFLALRTLIELANHEESRFPEAAAVLRRDNYVDDYHSGSHSLESTLALQTQFIEILKRGGFQLSKWAANHPALLENIPSSDVQTSCSFDKEEPTFIKILGLKWDPTNDVFSYSYVPIDRPCTKRSILSEISRIFDPLGFISPVSLLVKGIIQRLWLEELSWDAEPSADIIEIWNKFKKQLPQLAKVKIPRRIVSDSVSRLELHAFCDASDAGHAAIVYFRVVQHSGLINVFLICAKCRVNPLKVQSIPRLELMSAVLLSKLVELIKDEFSEKLILDEIITWSDSQVALRWLSSSPHRWKSFIANRVTQVQEIISPSSWRYVPSAQNPADCASRGLYPDQLVQQEIWWSGPEFLYKSPDFWPPQVLPDNNDISEALNEQKPRINQKKTKIARQDRLIALCVTTKFENHVLNLLLVRYSSLSKILRIIAKVSRMLSNCKAKKLHASMLDGIITPSESHSALTVLIKYVQNECFGSLISNIDKNHLFPKPYRRLALFLDSEGLLRVGGRIRHSLDLPYEVKHPILLPKSHRLTELLVEKVHLENCHPGLKTMHNLLLQNFWILSPRSAIYKCLARCIRCFRCKPKSYNPYMGDLPYFRVSKLKPFSHVCVDFAGPFFLTMSKHRGAKSYKGYICVIVCTTVKSIHLEVTSDLTTDAFVAAFRRFVARRGRVTQVWSDQGTNFKGAATLLSELARQCSETLNITWNFVPPGSPFMNGLAEAGVKSVKAHLLRVIGLQIFTFEEFYTFLTQVEALLNSRPLCAISTDANDLQPLTPSHFLTLEPTSQVIPDPDLSELKITRLGRWQLIQKLVAEYWKRWSQEYVNTLQERHKWSTVNPNIKENTLCVIRNEQKHPLQWGLGLVTKVYPGKDGIVRVADLKTATGTLQRPVAKLCPLPIN